MCISAQTIELLDLMPYELSVLFSDDLTETTVTDIASRRAVDMTDTLWDDSEAVAA
ncbi:MAG: hypothetical protein V7711_03025 [Pseudomonadales bacterium]